jgi:zinc protease
LRSFCCRSKASTEYRLANGLQVLLAPDASKPSTTVNLTYRVGSHENYGETGMAHLLEHLLFKGTPNTRRHGASSASAACASTAPPGSTAPTTSPASAPTTTPCAGTWPGRPTRWSTP